MPLRRKAPKPKARRKGEGAFVPAIAAAAAERRILLIRGEKVLLDSDLAELYGVRVSALNQAVKRNASRFPEDFFFRLNAHEADALKSQSVTSNPARGGRRRSTPAAFTEQGVAMLSSVLRSPRAVQVNIEIMRTFVRLRRLLATNEELRRKIHELERDTDDRFRVIFDAMRELMGDGAEPESSPKKPRIGFRAE